MTQCFVSVSGASAAPYLEEGVGVENREALRLLIYSSETVAGFLHPGVSPCWGNLM